MTTHACISPRTLDVDRSRRIATDRANDRSSVDRVDRVACIRLAVDHPSPIVSSSRHRFERARRVELRRGSINRVALTDLVARRSCERANAWKRWEEEENGNRR
jgi:hypothetical protein